MLKGFNYPLTPKGKSTLNPRPPWYYSSDFLNIEFWSQPSAVAALLPTGLDPVPLQRVTAMLVFTTGSLAGRTKNTSIRRVISIASFSYSSMRYTRRSRSPIAHISLSTTMRHLLAAGLKAIRSVSARCFRPGITLRQERQAPPSHRDRSLPARLPQADNGLLRHLLR